MKIPLLFTLALALAISGCSSMKKGEGDPARCADGPFSSSGRPLWPECKSIGPGSAPIASPLPPLGALPEELSPLGPGSGLSLPLPGSALPGPRATAPSAEEKKTTKPAAKRKKTPKARPAKKTAAAQTATPAASPEPRAEAAASPAPAQAQETQEREASPEQPAPVSNAPALKAQPATEPIPGTRKVMTSKGAERR